MRDPDEIPVVYMDTSVYGRPFDNPLVGSNRREIRAVAHIIEAIHTGTAELVTSFVVQQECAPATAEVRELEESLRVEAAADILRTPELEALAARLAEGADLKQAESLHIACAALSEATNFLSCNPRRIRKQAAIEAVLGRPFAMSNPADFVRDILAPLL